MKLALREFTGPLTRDLVQRPAEFGLGQLPARLLPEATVSSTCGYCSTGCSLKVHVRQGRAINLSPAADYPVNLGMACPKGWEAMTPLGAPDRASTPWLRDSRSGRLEPVDWERALREFTGRFKALLHAHGPESVAWLGTGQMPTEELAFLGALGKFGMGLVHGDANTRQCMATSVTAYKQSLGFDAPPFTYADLEESDTLVFIGSNLCVAHPILWQRVLRNRKQPAIVVLDPRRTETAMAATRHLALAPKSDLELLYGTAHLLLRNGWIDRAFVEAHTHGFGEFAEFVRAFTPERVSARTGLSPGQLEEFAATLHRGRAVSFWWTMGVNQSHEATRTAQAIINLALMTGNIGRPGTGPNSITGQCNAMGSRLFSNTTNLLGGHDFLNPAHREKVAGLLGLPAGRIPARGSLAYDEILQGVDEGRIKGLWVVGTNPVHSWIGRGDDGGLERLLGKLEFLVVQDMYASTETARCAHLVLPAGGWGEKDGTFINSERRIGVIRRVASPPGQALADFHIFRLVAHYWGCEELFREWTSPEAVFQILKRCSAGQPCDITGIRDYRHLDECGGIQWPWPATADREEAAPEPATERRLFEDGRFHHPDGRARFLFEAPRLLPEPPDAEYPLLLMTGRGSSSQWHTLTRTDKSEVLRRLGPARNYIELNPEDARRLGVRAGERVWVGSRRGRVQVQAVVTATVAAGQAFMPMHFPETNQITFPVVDPHSRQPAYKACAVRVEKARAGSRD